MTNNFNYTNSHKKAEIVKDLYKLLGYVETEIKRINDQ